MTEEREKELNREICVERRRLQARFAIARTLDTYIGMFPDKIKPPIRTKRYNRREWRCPECRGLVKAEALGEYSLFYLYFTCECDWEYAVSPDQLKAIIK